MDYECAGCGLSYGNMADAVACCANDAQMQPKSPGTQQEMMSPEDKVLDDQEDVAQR